MKKGQPKRRDLRKRIVELEKDNLHLRIGARAREVTASTYPERHVAVQQYHMEPFEKDPGMEHYARKIAIRACALRLAKTIAYNATEITEQRWPDGWRAVRMEVMIVPPFEQNAPEIREAIEEIKREDKK